MKVSSVIEMRNLDRTAVEKYGIEDKLLMENAGEAAYFVILQEFGIEGKRFAVFCGAGNNGGDGFVIARKIHSNGGDARVFILGDGDVYRDSARMNYEIVSRLPIEVKQIKNAASVRKEVLQCDCIVDAIFGTGITRKVEGVYRNIIELINESGKPVFSVDIPSGVHGDTGEIMGAAIRADCTVTFGLPKRGNMLYPGYDCCGELYVTHISFPPEHFDGDAIKVEVNEPPQLPSRNNDGHKGDFGEALFIAGASGYFGAPYFAALSFLKAGGGYSRLAAPSSITPFIAMKGSEIVFIPQRETESGSIALENKDSLIELAKKMDIVVVGPGLSLHEETQKLVSQFAGDIEKPILIDGDGITAICKDLDIVRKRKSPTIITPHLGEMSRMTGRAVSEIENDKIAALQAASGDLNAIIVLKGAHSLIGYPDERVLINMTGNSGMATAGSGDVLTGTIAAMFGLGLSIEDAVAKGVFIHGLSGDLAAEELGEDGITAQDILDYLPLAVRYDREDLYDDEGSWKRYRVRIV
jgi:hydroxyethylthiazole kinase-like uncharacterized protein yjeF